MTIPSLGSLGAPVGITPGQTTPAQSPGGAAGDGEGTGSPTLSGFAQFMSRLQQLEQSDPAKAKQVLGDIAGKLKTQAQQAGGAQAVQLNALADKFQMASDTGDLSVLSAKGQQGTSGSPGATHHHGHHGHHGKAQSSYQQNSGASLLDMLNSTLTADTTNTGSTKAG